MPAFPLSMCFLFSAHVIIAINASVCLSVCLQNNSTIRAARIAKSGTELHIVHTDVIRAILGDDTPVCGYYMGKCGPVLNFYFIFLCAEFGDSTRPPCPIILQTIQQIYGIIATHKPGLLMQRE